MRRALAVGLAFAFLAVATPWASASHVSDCQHAGDAPNTHDYFRVFATLRLPVDDCPGFFAGWPADVEDWFVVWPLGTAMEVRAVSDNGLPLEVCLLTPDKRNGGCSAKAPDARLVATTLVPGPWNLRVANFGPVGSSAHYRLTAHSVSPPDCGGPDAPERFEDARPLTLPACTGTLFFGDDPSDWYQVDLAWGELLTVRVQEAPVVDVCAFRPSDPLLPVACDDDLVAGGFVLQALEDGPWRLRATDRLGLAAEYSFAWTVTGA